MRIDDAPPAGWYPDPEGGSRLRWWEGTDWSDRFRMRPIESHVEQLGETPHVGTGGEGRWVPADPNLTARGVDTQAVVEQVRVAAREEAERAAQMFGRQARSAARDIQPLITQYTSKFISLFRRVAILVVVLAVAWFAFQVFAQKSIFDWIGDRVDRITENIQDGSGAGIGDADVAPLRLRSAPIDQ